jgi:hypothetical protein
MLVYQRVRCLKLLIQGIQGDKTWPGAFFSASNFDNRAAASLCARLALSTWSCWSCWWCCWWAVSEKYENHWAYHHPSLVVLVLSVLNMFETAKQRLI